MKNNKYTKIEPTQFSAGIIIKEDQQGNILYIPIDPANSDYQEYLKSLEDEANTL